MKTIFLAFVSTFCINLTAQDGMMSQTTDSIVEVTLPVAIPPIKKTAIAPATFTPALVDIDAYEDLLKTVKKHRKKRLLNLDDFVSLSKQPNVIILDTRSDSMYNAKHIKGAIHLNFADFTQFSLLKIIPDFTTKILIYCNNNINETPLLITAPRYFVTKAIVPKIAPIGTTPITLALNIPTYVNLYGYGYHNVYELNEFVSINDARIQFEGTAVGKNLDKF